MESEAYVSLPVAVTINNGSGVNSDKETTGSAGTSTNNGTSWIELNIHTLKCNVTCIQIFTFSRNVKIRWHSSRPYKKLSITLSIIDYSLLFFHYRYCLIFTIFWSIEYRLFFTFLLSISNPDNNTALCKHAIN